MVERRTTLGILAHAVMIVGMLIVAFPLYLAFVASTHTSQEIVQAPMPLLPGSHFWENYVAALTGHGGGAGSNAPVGRMMWVSLVTALVIAFGKIAVSLLSAFALVYFRFPFRSLFFWAIFVTLMLPVEVRILPTYKVVADLGLLDSYTGLIVPLIASATGTFLFRQFFMTVPPELAEAARIDGAGAVRFFLHILLPLARNSMAALFVIQFIYGWNQYLWPLVVTTKQSYYTVVLVMSRLVNVVDVAPSWNLIMAIALLAMIPPVIVVIAMQRWFVKGLVETEK